jgi:hypothetical protein
MKTLQERFDEAVDVERKLFIIAEEAVAILRDNFYQLDSNDLIVANHLAYEFDQIRNVRDKF